jgi:hypothetical protein
MDPFFSLSRVRKGPETQAPVSKCLLSGCNFPFSLICSEGGALSVSDWCLWRIHHSIYTLHDCAGFCRPDLVLNKQVTKVTRYLVSNEMLAGMLACLRDSLSALDSSSSMVEVTEDYTTHFLDMYVEKHKGKHLLVRNAVHSSILSEGHHCSRGKTIYSC